VAATQTLSFVGQTLLSN